jgi:hypothetical protein
MKSFKYRIGFWTLSATTLLLGSLSVFAAATAEVDDVVQDLSKTAKPGEMVGVECSKTAGDLDKRGKLIYEADTGSLRYDDMSAGAAK